MECSVRDRDSLELRVYVYNIEKLITSGLILTSLELVLSDWYHDIPIAYPLLNLLLYKWTWREGTSNDQMDTL